ncbi:MAG: AAA family ATPase, partial [candidate division WOR-3 bacterium]
MRLKKIKVQNFKSFKDVEIEFEKFNVIVGPNASGKTNLVDLFSLLKKIYSLLTPFPFLDWWGYNNVVWNQEEHLPIIVKMFFEFENYNFSFETIFTGITGKFEILKETLEIDKILTLEREGGEIRIKHNEKFLEEVWQTYSKEIQEFLKMEHLEKNKEDLIEQRSKIYYRKPFRLFSFFSRFTRYFSKTLSISLCDYSGEGKRNAVIIEPIIRIKRKIRKTIM